MKAAIIGPICKDNVTIRGETTSQMGSPCYYTGVALHRLGVDTTAFITHVEDEAWIRAHLGDLKFVTLPASGTITMMNEYPTDDPDYRVQGTVHHENPILPEHLPDLRGYDVIILGPLFHTDTPQALYEHLRKYKATIVYGNHGMISHAEEGKLVFREPERLLGILPYVDYIFLDEQELRFASGEEGIDAGVAKLQERGAKRVIITSGKQGSVVYDEHGMHAIPAYPPTTLVDPTGAGDSYLAGFVKGLELFDDPVSQGKLAAAVATLSIEKKGAMQATLAEALERTGLSDTSPKLP